MNLKGKQDSFHLTKLRSVDRRTNLISSLPLPLEGINPHVPEYTSGREISILLKEAKFIKSYFKNAKTDSEFVCESIPYLQNHHLFTSLKSAMIFLKNISPCILEDVKKDRRLEHIQRLIDSGSACGLPALHPVLIFAIACIFGNKIARGILKPKKHYQEANSYNAVSDIYALMLIPLLEAIFPFPMAHKMHLLTFDKKLNEAARYLLPRMRGLPLSGEDGAFAFTIEHIGGDFFPYASQAEILTLSEMLTDGQSISGTESAS